VTCYTLRHTQVYGAIRDPLNSTEGDGEVLTKPLPIIYQQSWLTREVPAEWSLANVMPIYEKGQKEDPRNYLSV